ncbi:hypothetical protein Z517_00817 [Fonsecaea pedrosoi CBS 271.37]|uniref:Uncharacterized protein n=1 Tax=Fonsecaea pedrosoi CBS 271.37 TaxID=1442368 RepID=A0A0D2FFI1_9EURO|nr:uncharacterized protein Z517_00817 [Fonsecaea pedrosoi CBS 271.37]KIW85427.1 hypothetical protein Z517_00817 [Fonsecaea pedrosoi CBS 271.37]
MSQPPSKKSFFPSPVAALKRSRPPPKPTSKDDAIRWAAGQPAPNNVPTSSDVPFGGRVPPSQQLRPQPPRLSSLAETPEPGQVPPGAPQDFGRPGEDNLTENLPRQMNTGTGGAETPAYVQAFLDAGKPTPPPAGSSGTLRPSRPTRPVPPTPGGTPRPSRPTRPVPPTPEPQPQAGPSQPRAGPSQ